MAGRRWWRRGARVSDTARVFHTLCLPKAPLGPEEIKRHEEKVSKALPKIVSPDDKKFRDAIKKAGVKTEFDRTSVDKLPKELISKKHKNLLVRSLKSGIGTGFCNGPAPCNTHMRVYEVKLNKGAETRTVAAMFSEHLEGKEERYSFPENEVIYDAMKKAEEAGLVTLTEKAVVPIAIRIY